jgi:hypothetical protein
MASISAGQRLTTRFPAPTPDNRTARTPGHIEIDGYPFAPRILRRSSPSVFDFVSEMALAVLAQDP